MSNRDHAALQMVVAGPVNPSGVAHSIIEACQEARLEPSWTGTSTWVDDPAIRLMVWHLATICGWDLYNGENVNRYSELVRDCKRREGLR